MRHYFCYLLFPHFGEATLNDLEHHCHTPIVPWNADMPRHSQEAGAGQRVERLLPKKCQVVPRSRRKYLNSPCSWDSQC